MRAQTIARRYPIGRIVWIRLFGSWARAHVTDITRGPTIHVRTEAGLTVYVDSRVAHSELRVSEPYQFTA